MSSCASDSGVIKVRSKNFSILPPPSDWKKQTVSHGKHSALSREISSGAIYAIQWRNDAGSFIGLSAIKAVDPSGEPLIILDKFYYSALHYMKEGHRHDLDRLRETCPDLIQKYTTKQGGYIKDGYSKFKQYDMLQGKLSSRVECNDYNPLFPLIIDMVSIWSDSYYYMFQLTTKEGDYDRDSVIFQEVINTLISLSEK
ncbi:MAG: hypothetical protein ABFS32_21645 [Bacteroidota bacterium]